MLIVRRYYGSGNRDRHHEPAGSRHPESVVLTVVITALLTFSSAPAQSAIITVSSATDSTGAGNGVSLREALLSTETDADFNADVEAIRTGVYGEDGEIRFAIGSGAQSLDLISALPPVRHTVLIDGTTQPGYLDVPLITLDGSVAGAQVTGLSIAALSSASVLAPVVRDFGGDGIAIHEALLADGFESGGLGTQNGPDPPLVTLTDVGSISNGGIGLRVVGGLAATRVEIASNGSDAVLVDSGREVLLKSCKVHDNAGAGIRALAAIGDPYGLHIQGAGTEIADNGGDGVVLGDPVNSGPVRAPR
jgi:hypothetical protein